MARTWTEAQTAAMNLRDKTLLVSAAAGSGKTSVLTERIIRSLTDPEHPADLSKMLIVTFTRAAAAELKARISSALSDALAEDPENEHLSRQLFLLGSAQISTIDSFFQRTVRDHFEQLDIPSTFRIADDSELSVLSAELLGEIIEEFYTKYTPNTAQGATLELVRSNRFAHALNHLLTNRSDGKLIPLLLEFYEQFSKDPLGIDRLKALAVRLRADRELPFLQTEYGQNLKRIYTELIREDLEILQDFKIRLSGDPAAEKLCTGLLTSDCDYLQGLLDTFTHGDVKLLCQRIREFDRGSFPRIKEKSTTVLRFQAWRDLLKKHIESMQKDLSHAVDDLSDQILQTAELCEMLHLLFTTYRDRFLAQKKARGMLEYNDVRGMLYSMLTLPDGSPSPFSQSLSEQYDAVYIDEYQDVDGMQDRIFAAIGKDRRFMVGDIKQSIYGFRGSEPSIFADYRRAFPLHTDANASDADGLCVFMSENFRCDQPIIDFTNQVCSFLFSASEDSVGYRPQDDLCASKRHDSPLPQGHPVPVQIGVFPALPRKKAQDGDEEETVGEKPEAIWVANEIERLLHEEHLDNGKPILPSDIVILVRSKKHGDSILRQLARRGIPAHCEVAENPLHEPIVVDFINLLRVIDNPYRDSALSEFLISPLGGFTLEEVHLLRQGLPAQYALFDALESGADSAETPLLAKKAKALLEWLEGQRKLAAVHSADRFLHLLLGEERIRPFAIHPAFRYLHEQARIYQRSSFCGLYGFLGHLNKLLEKDEIKGGVRECAASAVTVMTIHHSKGLEFPVVFLYNSAAAFNKDDLKKPLIYHKNAGIASLLYNEESAVQEDNLLRTAVKRVVEQDSVEENIRTLYVALTRARERLYVTGTLAGKADTALTQAQAIQRGMRASILKAPSYLIWILAATLERSTDSGAYHALVHIFSQEELAQLQEPVGALPVDEEATPSLSALTASPLTARDEAYLKTLRERDSFAYPLSFLQGIPTKVAASRLRPDLLDELMQEQDEERAITAQLELMSKGDPSFDDLLAKRRLPKATEIGTATHAFLEFCDFERLATYGIDAERDRLTDARFITARNAELLNREQLDAFLVSDLMQWLRCAKKIYREQTFGIFIPIRELTARTELDAALQAQTVFVQGSIDLLIVTDDGKRLLIDYKTDHLTSAELESDVLLARKMKTSHASQLACYARAVKELFGTYPDEVRIYSLPAGRTVAIDLSDLLPMQ